MVWREDGEKVFGEKQVEGILHPQQVCHRTKNESFLPTLKRQQVLLLPLKHCKNYKCTVLLLIVRSLRLWQIVVRICLKCQNFQKSQVKSLTMPLDCSDHIALNLPSSMFLLQFFLYQHFFQVYLGLQIIVLMEENWGCRLDQMDDKEETKKEETRKVESKASHDGTLLMLLLTHIFSARDQSLDSRRRLLSNIWKRVCSRSSCSHAEKSFENQTCSKSQFYSLTVYGRLEDQSVIARELVCKIFIHIQRITQSFLSWFHPFQVSVVFSAPISRPLLLSLTVSAFSSICCGLLCKTRATKEDPMLARS